jgi:2,3-bisphosphoglycerate-dependent phosphoglycerate mutase
MTLSDKHILVYIARHGRTDLNKRDAFRGPIDAPLDTTGRRDAHQLGFYFEPVDVCCIVHSDLHRTRETAKIIAQAKADCDAPHGNPNLRAWNVGDLGGKPKNEENQGIVDWHTAHPEVPMPGGESLNEFKARIRPLIVDAVEIGIRTGDPVLIVAHSSVIHEVGSMIGNDHEYTLVEPGGVAAIYIQDGKLDAEPVFKPRPKHSRAEIT